MGESTKPRANDIAVVGMACRFPGDATDPEKLWGMLEQSVDAWQEFPRDRFNLPGWYHPDPNRVGSFNIRGAHLLKGDCAEFDAPFFSVSTKEAISMDPQQRLLLEVSYEALDSAGIPAESLRNTATGVWCGSFVRDYEQSLMRDPDTTPPYSATGTGIAILANRISHVFDLAGTSQTIDTGCSASMVCIHQACRSLASGETSLGIAAGAGLIYSPNTMVPMAMLNILSPDGRCFTFDERANGYGRGEGVGVVVLKRVEDALRDNDTIRAVIRSTGSNQDGHTQGITLPDRERQIANIKATYASAGLSANRTAYVECHGTGTQAGDLIEVNAVSESLCRDRPKSQPLIIGSVKTNIGHLEGSAGVAGLMKGVLAVEKGRIPKHANFVTPNPKIDFEKLKVKVPTETLTWPTEGLRRVSVNSFGFGGTNAHAVVDDAAHYLEELGLKGQHNTALPIGDSKATAISASSTFQRTQLFVFSGRDEAGLSRVLASQTEYVKAHKSAKQFSANYAYTLFSRRSRMDCRTFAVAQSGDELLRKMQSGDTREVHRQIKDSVPRVALVFCGQGAQWHAMGRELMEYDVFRSSMAAASRYLQSALRSTFCLLDELRLDKELSQVHQARVAQPAVTAIQVALVDLLRASNVDPVAVVGHSSGEIAAAYAIGAISREDAWKIAFHRGRCAERLTIESPVTGAMLAVSLSEADVQPYLDKVTRGAVDIACVNGPASVTLSGNERQIIQLQALLTADRIQATRVRVKTAYHSHHMEHIMGDYLQSIRDVQPSLKTSATVMYSSVSQDAIDAKKLNAKYWVRNLVAPVQFFGAVKCMIAESKPNIMVEVGPHRVWEPVLRQIVGHMGGSHTIDSYLPLLRRGRDAAETALEVMGALWQLGCPVKLDWAIASKLETLPRHLIDVPSYPWDHSKRYWSESYLSEANRFRPHGREDLIGAPMENSHLLGPYWRGFFRLSENPWIEDHVIQKSILYPAGGLVCMAIEAAKQMADPDVPVEGFEVSSFKILKPVLIPSTAYGLEHALRAKLLESGSYEFSILSQPTKGAWTVHATGQFSIKYKPEKDDFLDKWARSPSEMDLYIDLYSKAKEKSKTRYVPRQFYERIDVIGMSYGPQFRNIVELSKGSDTCCSVVRIPDTKSKMPCQFEFDHVIHPTTLDAMLQTVIPLGEDAMLPTSFDSIFVAADLPRGAGSLFRGFSTARSTSYREASAEIIMFDEPTENLAVAIKGLVLRSLPPATHGVGFLPTNRNLCSEVVWKPDADATKFSSARELIDSMGHQKPSMAVCQISGGLQTTRWVVEILAGGYTTPRFSKYTLAYLSEGTSGLVLSSSSGWSCLERVESQKNEAAVLNGQQRYDLILLGVDQIHDLDAYAKIVKPQGRVLIQLETQPDGSQLDRIARALQTGDLVYESFIEQPEIGHNFVIARHDSPRRPTRTRHDRVYLLLPEEMSDLLRSFKYLVSQALSTLGVTTVDATLKSISDMQKADFAKPFISFLEIDQPVLFSLSEYEFSPIHRLLDSAKSLLWLSRGAQMNVTDPRRATFIGLARTLRSEDARRNIISLDLAGDVSLNSGTTTDTVVSVFNGSFSKDSSAAAKDTEFVLDDTGRLFIPRLVTLPVLNDMIEHGPSKPHQVTELPVVQIGRNVKLDVEELCKADRAVFIDDEAASEALWSNQIRIAVEETYLQPSDKDVITGETASEIGVDVVGTVTEVGSNVCRFKVSDKVVAIAKGTIKTSVVVDANLVRKVTDIGPYSPTALLTALYGFYEVARICSKTTVLILEGASLCGQAAINVTKAAGCVIAVGFSTRAQLDVLLQIRGLNNANLVYTSDPAFVSALRRRRCGQGFDVVFSPSPNYIKEAFECVSDGGHVIQVSSGAVNLSGIRMPSNVHFECFDIHVLLKTQHDLLAKLDILIDMTLIPCFFTAIRGRNEFDFAQVREATQSLTQDPYLGVYVLRVNDMTRIKVPVAVPELTKLSPDSTYVVVGGLGGLGRSIACLMAEKGARHIAILSRSPSNAETGEFVRSLAEQGVNIRAVPVDICDEKALKKALERIEKAMPRIMGVVQCAAVLDDATFSNLEYGQWCNAVAPKTIGSWNLHRHISLDVDFFIMLSSSSGVIGNRGQANYAAGNCFQDALAHHRAALGYHTVSLDLGLVLEAGMVARDEKLLDVMRAAGFFGMRLDDFHLVLQRAMDNGGGGGDGHNSRLPPQVVTAVGTGGLTRQNKPSDPFWTRTALFAYLNTVDAPPAATDGDAATTTGGGGIRDTLVGAVDPARAASLLYPELVAALARRKGMVPADFEPHRGFDAYGIDSMDSIFLLGWIARETGASVQTLDRRTIWDLCDDVARQTREAARRDAS